MFANPASLLHIRCLRWFLLIAECCVLLAACDGQPVPTPPPPTATPTTMPVVLTATAEGELRVSVPASQYAAGRNDLLPGYELVAEQRGSYFYSAQWQKADGFRYFTQTISIYADVARAQAEVATQQAELGAGGAWEETGGVGDEAWLRRLVQDGGSYPLGKVEIVYHYANAVVAVSFSYGRNYVTDDEAGQRARGLATIIAGKLIEASAR